MQTAACSMSACACHLASHVQQLYLDVSQRWHPGDLHHDELPELQLVQLACHCVPGLHQLQPLQQQGSGSVVSGLHCCWLAHVGRSKTASCTWHWHAMPRWLEFRLGCVMST